ncbi:MAG: hypothetical protein ACE5FU_14465, partial [Nitrospinota bacterium]
MKKPCATLDSKSEKLFNVGSKLNISAAFNARGVADSILGQSLAACNGIEDLRLKDEKVVSAKQILYIPETDPETLAKTKNIFADNPAKIEKNDFLSIAPKNFILSEKIWDFFYKRGFIGDNFRAQKKIDTEEEG